MTEITRVPLQPLAQGSLLKLWLGVALGLLVAAGLAWASMPPMVRVQTIKAGTGSPPTLEDVVLINYRGTLAASGKEFDKANNAVFPMQGVVPGFTKALLQMKKGGKYKVRIPAALAYGDKVSGPIPANSDLDFEIELLDFRSRAEIEQQQRMMQQMQAMQAQKGGAGAGAPPPPGM